MPLRNVALTAMELATLHRLFPGRPNIGVGHGVQDWMAQVGARAESPLTLLREQTTALRALLAGERVTVDGRYVHLDDVALDQPPGSPPAVLAGAGGPRSLRLCGEVADGVILTASTSLGQVGEALALVNEGRAAAGRTDAFEVVVYLLAATGPDAEQRMEAERSRTGDVGVAGDAATVADAVRRWAAAGAGTVVLQPTLDDPDPEAFVRFTAEEVRPLVPGGRTAASTA